MPAPKKPPATITPPWLSFDYIRQQADNFRQQYVKPPNLVPVPMEEIVELDLKFQIIPIIGLQDRIDVDGFLTNNFTNRTDEYENIAKVAIGLWYKVYKENASPDCDLTK